MNFIKFLECHKPIIDKELDQYLLKKINQEQDNFLKYCYKMIQSFSRNGKRLRPISMILSYNANGKKDKKIMPIALAIELFHVYTLIHDDIMDEDEYRRENKTIIKEIKDYFNEHFDEKQNEGMLFSDKSSKYSTSISILLGNITKSLAYDLIEFSEFNDDLKLKVIKKFNDIDTLLNKGQILDINSELMDIDENYYIEVIRLKTAELFGLAYEIGSMLVKTNDNNIENLRQFGINSAMAFQIQDDLIDINETQKKFGSDIKNNKKTLLYIYAKNKDKSIDKYYGIKNLNAIKKVIKIFHETGSIKYNLKKAEFYSNKSKNLIQSYGIYYKEILLSFCDYVKNRLN